MLTTKTKTYLNVLKLYLLHTLVLNTLKLKFIGNIQTQIQKSLIPFFTFHGFSYLCIEYKVYNEYVAEIIKLKSKMLFKLK